MKNGIKQFISGMSLFWRYFFFLIAVMAIFLISIWITSGQFNEVLQDAYLSQTRSSFEQNGEMFAKDLRQTRVISSLLEESDYYQATTSAMTLDDSRSKLSAAFLREEYMMHCTMLGLPMEGFVYFKKSKILLTRYRMFEDGKECFDSYMIYEHGADTIINELEKYNSIRVKILPAAQVLVEENEAENCLTLLTRGAKQDAVYGFLYPEQTILKYFHMEALPPDTWLEIVDENGETLFHHGDDRHGEFIRLDKKLPNLNCVVSIGVPTVYFRTLVLETQVAMHVVFLVAVILGLALCILFSHASVRPFRHLIRVHAPQQSMDQRPLNELATIDRVLRNAQERNADLRGMLLSSLLVRAFSGLHISNSEYEKLAAAFPLFGQPMQVAVVKDRAADTDLNTPNTVMSLVRETLTEQFLCEYINIREMILLFPAGEENFDDLQHAMMEINRDCENSPRVVCGVSAEFQGIEMIGGAIRQAQFCVPETNERVVVRFVQETEGAAEQEQAVTFDFRRFRQALSGWNQKEMLEQIDAYALSAGKQGAERLDETFYRVLFLLRDAAGSAKIDFTAHENMAYQNSSSPTANLRRLKKVVNDLFEKKAAMQQSDKLQLCREIVEYIEAHLGDTLLCQTVIAQQFCVSERFVYNAVQSVTGMNFSNYLTSQRMKKAAGLLRDTNENISSVAVKCGYSVESTFYRNFKKYYQITPVEYKNSIN